MSQMIAHLFFSALLLSNALRDDDETDRKLHVSVSPRSFQLTSKQEVGSVKNTASTQVREELQARPEEPKRVEPLSADEVSQQARLATAEAKARYNLEAIATESQELLEVSGEMEKEVQQLHHTFDKAAVVGVSENQQFAQLEQQTVNIMQWFEQFKHAKKAREGIQQRKAEVVKEAIAAGLTPEEVQKELAGHPQPSMASAAKTEQAQAEGDVDARARAKPDKEAHQSEKREQLADVMASSAVLSSKPESKIHVVAITDSPMDERVAILKRSLHTGGFSTDSFHYTSAGNFSWSQRLHIQQQIVQDAAAEDPESVFLFVDGFDIFTLGGQLELMDKFQKTGKDALFSCVTYPYPHQCDGFDWKNDGKCDKDAQWGAGCQHWCRFACAGAFMGKAGALTKLFAEHPIDGSRDDQCYYNSVLANNTYNIALDHRHEVFFSTTSLLQCSLERKDGRLLVTSTGTQPSVIHFDATHPNAEYLGKFYQDTVSGPSGPLCGKNASCVDWCWDWDFGDMIARLSPSDKELIGAFMHWPKDWSYISSKESAYRIAVIALTIFVFCVALVVAATKHKERLAATIGKWADLVSHKADTPACFSRSKADTDEDQPETSRQ